MTPRIGVSVSRSPSSGYVVRINQSLDIVGLDGFVLQTSNVRPLPPQLPGSFPRSTSWLLEDRLRNQGQRKGRAVGIWQGDRLVTVCSWHLGDNGPPVLFELCSAADVGADDRDALERVLMLGLRTAAMDPALRRSATALRWTDAPLKRAPRASQAAWRGEVRARATARDFQPCRRKPAAWRRDWLTERTWSVPPP